MHPSSGRSGHLLPQGEKVCWRQPVWNWRVAFTASALFLSPLVPAGAQAPNPVEELGRHLEGMKRRIDDPSIGVAQREILAIEAAGTLDRAAQAESRIDAKQAHWNEAVRLLDEFREKNPDQTRKQEFQLQAAVYRWAQARAWHDRHTLFPADDASLERETKALDDAIVRLRAIVSDEASVLADNIRFRLAWALADQAALEEPGSPTRKSLEEEALKLLERDPSEPRLSGYHGLLKAELLRRSGKIAEAAAVATAAARTNPPPPDAEILDVTVRLLVDDRKFAEAKSVATSSKLSPASKALSLARIALAEGAVAGRRGASRRFPRPPSADPSSPRAESARTADRSVGVGRVGRRARRRRRPRRLGRARRGDRDSGRHRQGGRHRGESRGTRRAERRQEAAAGYRLRGAGFLFQAGKYVEADALLAQVVDDAQAGTARPKAGLLQCLARGRAITAGSQAVTTRDYTQALERQIREFPDDPTAVEARWLLGNVEQARGDRDKARTLWMAIPPASSRWIDARLAIVDAMRRDVESRLDTADDNALAKEFSAAQTFLTESQATAQARDESDRVELLLREARLNLVPKLGKPRQAQRARSLQRHESDEIAAVSSPSRPYDHPRRARPIRGGGAQSAGAPDLGRSGVALGVPRRDPASRSIRVEFQDRSPAASVRTYRPPARSTRAQGRRRRVQT